MRTIDKASALAFVRAHRAAFDAEAPRNPFASSTWMLQFISEVAADDSRFIALESDRGGDSALLLCADGSGSLRLSGVANFYTSLYSPIVTTSRDPVPAVEALTDQLASTIGGQWCTLDLSPLAADEAPILRLQQSLRQRHAYVRQYDCFGNWYLPCAGLSFDSYMAARPSQLRNTWARKAKRFEADGGRLDILTAPTHELDTSIEQYEEIMRRSWKRPEPYPRFIAEWARRCAEEGWLRLGIARIDDVPVAAQFWFTMHGRANIFKLGYDDRYAKSSAGTLLTAHLFRHALDTDRVSEIDYLTGDDPYKRDWMSHRRERIGVRACNLTTIAGLAHGCIEYVGARSHAWRHRRRACVERSVA